MISISLKFKFDENPVPNALEKASLAANLLEKKATLSLVSLDNLSSLLL